MPNWTHFSCKKNTIFERVIFNCRCQGEDKTAKQFITALFAIAENCNYGNLRDELIQDRLVVGIRDTALSGCLQTDADLTLNKAMKAVRQQEAIREQQTVLHNNKTANDNPDNLDSVKTKVKSKQLNRKVTVTKPDVKSCGWCGKSYHSRDKCPAKDVICHKCQKRGHFSSQCFSKRTVSQHSVDTTDSLDATHSSDDTITSLDVVQTGNNSLDSHNPIESVTSHFYIRYWHRSNRYFPDNL